MITDITEISDQATPADETSSWLLSLDEIEGTALSIVGGKSFRLAQLKQNGFNVPSGLVLTADFFKAHIRHTKLTPLWMGSPDIAVTTDSLSWLADALKTKPLAKPLSQALNRRLTEVFGDEVVSFAVRSSAIDEDQRDHTFAGIHLTELGVPRPALPIAITRCWASALSEQALDYRQVHGMSIQGIQMAVLIQPMLAPTISGVGFTVNPLTGSRDEFVIEATWGLGEALVSGEIQPYQYTLANQPPDYPSLDEQPGYTILPDGNPAAEAPLTPAMLINLARQLEHIQALMGEAQDVEWAIQDDTLHILQSRPVALPPPPPEFFDVEWTLGTHPEYLPDLPSPLFSSFLERSQQYAINFFGDLGLKVEGLGPYIKLILGRPYLNLTFLKRIISQIGMAPGKLLYTIGHTEEQGLGSALSIDLEKALASRRAYAGVIKHLFTTAGLVERHRTLVEAMVKTLAQEKEADDAMTLRRHLRQQQQVYGEFLHARLALASVLSAATALGSGLLASATQNPATIITALAQKGVTTLEGTLNQRLLALARLARADEATRRYLTQAAPDFADYADTPALSADFRAAFESLLDQFGDRALYEADLGWPRYREAPATLLRIIRQYAEDSQALELAAHSRPITWDSLTGQGESGGVSLWRRWLARPFIRIVRRFLKLREALSTVRAQATVAGREWSLALGRRWMARGWLEQAEDIFWLTLDEIERTLMAEAAVGVGLAATVQVRKETYQTYADTPMPFTLAESQIFAIEPGTGLAEDGPANVLVGLPISPGQVRGRIIVLKSPADFKPTEPTEEKTILVMPTTDPAWLPLLHRASGLIVEMGGLLSHGSVIAREYGVPGVANIPDATHRFQTGETVLLDGSTGVVQRLEGAG